MIAMALAAVLCFPAFGQSYPLSDDHLASLYANADGKYVWHNWKGSVSKWQKRFRADLEKTLGIDRMREEMKGFKPEAKQIDSEDM